MVRRSISASNDAYEEHAQGLLGLAGAPSGQWASPRQAGRGCTAGLLSSGSTNEPLCRRSNTRVLARGCRVHKSQGTLQTLNHIVDNRARFRIVEHLWEARAEVAV